MQTAKSYGKPTVHYLPLPSLNLKEDNIWSAALTVNVGTCDSLEITIKLSDVGQLGIGEPASMYHALLYSWCEVHSWVTAQLEPVHFTEWSSPIL